MNLLQILAQQNIPELRQEREQMRISQNERIGAADRELKAMDHLIEAAVKLQPNRDVSTTELLITNEPLKTEPEPRPCVKAAEIQQVPEAVRPVNPKCTDRSMPVVTRAALFLETAGRATAMVIGTAINMPQPSHMDSILQSNPDVFAKGAGNFWALK
jgi:hypothetical protein